MVVIISDDYLDSDACDFQTKFALSLCPGQIVYNDFYLTSSNDTALFYSSALLPSIFFTNI